MLSCASSLRQISKKIGYCRVSTDDQNPDLQLTAVKRAGCRTIFTDQASGATTQRPALTKCLKALKTGDVLVVWKLDRLGRALRDLIGLLDDLKTLGGCPRKNPPAFYDHVALGEP